MRDWNCFLGAIRSILGAGKECCWLHGVLSHMERKQCKWLFDDADEQLLNELDSLFASPESDQLVSPLFEECFHPRGIKELAAPVKRCSLFSFYKLYFTFMRVPYKQIS